jgi:RNA polymerase sigma-70 factor (ECF subfamily)
MDADLLVSDRALLEAFRLGRKEALVAVWRTYYPLISSLAARGFGPYRGFGSVCDVEDLVSATFTAAFDESCRLRYDGLTPYGAFLLGIARNLMRKQIKKGMREPLPDFAQTPDLASEGPTPEQQLIDVERQEVLRRFPETLDAEEREVFFGFCRDGLSEERLALALQRTRHRVRKVLHRVQRQMRRYLKQLGLEPG